MALATIHPSQRRGRAMHKRHASRLRRVATAGLLAVSGLGGCASIPDVTISYRAVRWGMFGSVVSTVTCTQDSKRVVVDRGATFVPLYAARNDKSFKVHIKALDRYFADSDFAVELTDDGRLKGINQSTTGQGEAVVKAAIGASIAFGARPSAGIAPAAVAVDPPADADLQQRSGAICDVVKAWSVAAPDQLRRVALVQQVVVVPTATFDGATLTTDADSQAKAILAALANAGLNLNVQGTAALDLKNPQPIDPQNDAVAGDEVPLELQKMGSVSVAVRDSRGPIGSKSLAVPLNETFKLPIPKAALFGKQSFKLGLAESGRIVSIGYGRTTGVPGALGAVQTLAGAESSEDAAKAAALKAAADVIAQQKRYSDCVLKPEDCPK